MVVAVIKVGAASMIESSRNLAGGSGDSGMSLSRNREMQITEEITELAFDMEEILK
jgi:hypothetical protein